MAIAQSEKKVRDVVVGLLLSVFIEKSLGALWCTEHFGTLIAGDTQMERKIGNQTFDPISCDLYGHLIAAKCPKPLRIISSTLQVDITGAVTRMKSGMSIMCLHSLETCQCCES